MMLVRTAASRVLSSQNFFKARVLWLQPYLTVNWWHDELANAGAFNMVVLGDLYPSNRYEVKLGLNADLGQGWSGWGNLGYEWGQHSYRSNSMRVGVKFTW